MSESTAMIRKRFSAVTTVAGVLLLLSCGKTRNVSDSPSSAAGGGAGSVTGGGGGTAGYAGGVVTWDPLECHVTPVPKPNAPGAQEQWALARAYCVALGDQGCLTSGAPNSVPGCTVDEAVESCVAQLLWFHDNVASECEDVWRKDIACGAKSTFVGPICDGASTFGPTFGSVEACAAENVALLDCNQQHSADVEIAGSYTTCYYPSGAAPDSACRISCQVGEYPVQLNCSGPQGLPKQCGCMINGFTLPGLQPVFVNSCAEAAQQAADGLCTGKLDCCFEYLDRDKQACMCVEPADFGYASCEAMMAAGQGQRVDICPGLLQVGAGTGCWPPGACPP